MIIRLACALLLTCAAGCFNFDSLEIVDVGGKCGSGGHLCHVDLRCAKIDGQRVCVRDGGGTAGDKCSGKLPCTSAFKCDAETNICRDPCATVTCGDYGMCVATDGVALCVCEPGFVNEQQHCVGAPGQLCSDAVQPCQAGLICNTGRCAEPCGGTLCVNGATCDMTQQPPACSCPSGTRVDSGRGQCISVCTNVVCSEHGTCGVDSGQAACNCDLPYIANGFDCVLPNCEPAPPPYKRLVCDGEHMYEYDSCGSKKDLAESCGARGCTTANGCYPITWKPRDATFDNFKIDSADFVIRSDGTLVVAARGLRQQSQAILAFRQWTTELGWDQLAASANVTLLSPTVGSVQLEVGPRDQLAYICSDVSGDEDQIHYAEWSNGAWETKGLSANGLAIGRMPSFAFDSGGRPAISYVVGSGGEGDVYFLSWRGASWVAFGGSATGNGISGVGASRFPVVGFDEFDSPFVGWFKNSSVYLTKWAENDWRSVTSVSSSNSVVNQLGLAFSKGSMALAWSQANGIHLLRRDNDGQSSDTIVGGGTDGAYASGPSVVFDGQGAPIVAWYEYVDPFEAIYVRRWDATAGAWVKLGDKPDTGAGLAAGYEGAMFPRLRISGSQLCVGWMPEQDGNTYALQCTVL